MDGLVHPQPSFHDHRNHLRRHPDHQGHCFTLADGTKKSAGVVLPSQLTFGTAAAEIMECVAGSCEYKLDGTDQWLTSKAGESFQVPANSKFDIRVTESYHYICHYA
jgi:uncharacterized protein YaiE (UPF0345 family)